MHEGLIRATLREQLDREHPDRDDTRIREELGLMLGRTRIDMAVINGQLSGYEIKSDQDTLARLPLQADLYSLVMDELTVVTGERYADKVRDLVPPWWGLTVAVPAAYGCSLERRRDPEPNPGDRDPLAIVQLLWRDEVAAVLTADEVPMRRTATRWELWDLAAEHYPLPALLSRVRHALKVRRVWPGG